MCRGLRGHKALVRSMEDEVFQELRRANLEVTRLRMLFEDVKWYNFETQARKWRNPWHETWGATRVTLHGCRVLRTLTARFPIYHDGPVSDAPPLPPRILLNDLEMAKQLVAYWTKVLNDIVDYAPGGVKYKRLCKRTLVGRTLSKRFIVDYGGGSDVDWEAAD